MNQQGTGIEPAPAAGWDVRHFGAKGDGKADDTAAFQHALDVVAKAGGGALYAPPGRFLFRGNLKVPPAVSLVGSFLAPPAHNGIRDAGLPKPGDDGTTLLPTAGAGSESGSAFITLDTNSTLRGVVIDRTCKQECAPDSDERNHIVSVNVAEEKTA